jgi:diguanylate cyclase (GGDEF)-like protein
VLNTRDASAQKQLEERLSHQAFHDALTGLANRELFFDRVGHALERARREVHTVAVLFVDLDGFKGVNDSLGHARGDELLVLIAERFSSCLRPGDTVARIGGDEFAVLLEAVDDAADAVQAGHRLREVLADAFMIDGREVLVQASVGVAATDDGHATADELVRNADLAMYRAKTNNGGIEVFEIGMHTALVRRLELENDLRHALERNELVLLYQPVLELSTCRLVGAEALIRWKHPSGALLSAMDFVPLAEETGLIAEIGAWVLREACTQAALWQVVLPEAERSQFRVNVNLSGRQMVTNAVIGTIEGALAETGLDPGTLVLEMTESVMITSNTETVDLLGELKALGIRLAIDDFGTGYSSLSYLSRFPVDVLKIDRSFVEKLAFDAQSAELIQTIVQLGRSLDLETVAEGIETIEQLDELRRIGCEFGQGYLFSAPVPAREITTRLRAGSRVFTEAPPAEMVMAAGSAYGNGSNGHG